MKTFRFLSVLAVIATAAFVAFAPAPRDWGNDSQFFQGRVGIGRNPESSANMLYVLGTSGSPGTVISDDDGGTIVTVTDSTIVFDADDAVNYSTRVQFGKGANVASASVVTLGADGNFFDITGTTTINRFVATDWQAGHMFWTQFNGSITIADSSVTGAAAGNVLIRTKSGSNLSATSNDIVPWIYDGTQVWQAGELIALEN